MSLLGCVEFPLRMSLLYMRLAPVVGHFVYHMPTLLSDPAVHHAGVGMWQQIKQQQEVISKLLWPPWPALFC